MKKIILGYKIISALGCEGEDSGWSFAVQKDGKVLLKRYKHWDNKYPYYQSETSVSLDGVKEIQEYLLSQIEDIRALPHTINNWSMDGAFDELIFLGKKLGGLNLEYRDADDYRYWSENTAVKIFWEACKILQRYAEGFKIVNAETLYFKWTTDDFDCERH